MKQTKPYIIHENGQARRLACMGCRKRVHLCLMLLMNCSRTLHPWRRISYNSVKVAVCMGYVPSNCPVSTVSIGYFKDEWKHKTYFLLFPTLNISLEQNLYLKWRNGVFMSYRFLFFLHITDSRTKTFRERQTNVM